MPDKPKEVTFDRPKLERLKKAQKEAADAGLPSFDFEGALLDTQYAKYLIEYLETQLPK